jgi:mono/diheme cytochrome c family protein
MTKTRQLVLALALAIGAAGCDESLSEFAGPTPDLQPTFSSIQTNIFETTDVAGRQACVACHTNNGRNPAGGLTLLRNVSYAQLVNVASTQKPATLRVRPNDPENSYLLHKIDGRAGIVGRRMPFAGPPYLTDNQIAIVRRWIELGALNN